MPDFIKIRILRADLFHGDGQTDTHTDMTKLIVTFRNFANAVAVFALISSYRLLCCPIKICERFAIISVRILVNCMSRIIELITQLINQ